MRHAERSCPMWVSGGGLVLVRRLSIWLLAALISLGLAAPVLAAPAPASDSARAYTLNQIVSKLRSHGLKCSGPRRWYEGDDAGPARRQVTCRPKGTPVDIAEYASVETRKQEAIQSCRAVFYTGRILGRVDDVIPENGLTPEKAEAAIRRVARILRLPVRLTEHTRCS